MSNMRNIIFFKYKDRKNEEKFKDLEKEVIYKLKLNTVYIDVYEIIEATVSEDKKTSRRKAESSSDVTAKTIAELTMEMTKAAELLQFELAAQLRDEIKRLKGEI